jgi:purine catabolism regulator
VDHEITVRGALALPTLRDTEVVAGHAGLDRTVRHVSVVAGTEFTRWVKPRAVLLCTGYLLGDRGTALPDIVSELHAREVACLAVRLGSWLQEFPPELLQAADRVGLPVVRLTDRFAFDDILLDVLGRVNTALAADLELAERVHAGLADILLSGGSVSRIPAEISRLLGAEAVLVDPAGEPIAQGGGPVPATRHDWSTLEAAARDPRSDLETTDTLVLRIGNASNHLGYLVCTRPGLDFSSSEVRALERSCTVAALALTQQAAVREVEVQYRGELLGRVLRGEVTDPAAVRGLFHDVGWRIPGRCRVLAVSIEASTAVRGRATWWLRAAGMPLLRSSLGGSGGAAVAVHEGSLVAVTSAEEVDRLRTAASRVLASFERRAAVDLDALMTAGLGRECRDVGALARGHRQAQVAASAARRRPLGRRICEFEELGALGPVLAAAEDDGLTEVEDSPLAPLEELHPRDRQESLATLRAILEDNMNLAEASRALHCHYNTIRHRVRRLEDLLGPFTTDSDVRLSLCLALRLRQLAR